MLILSALAAVIGLIPGWDSATDLHLHDTYFVISFFHLNLFLGLILLAEAGIYAATEGFKQWKWLQVLHVISVPPVIVILILSAIPPTMRWYGDVGVDTSPWNDEIVIVIARICILFFIACQIGFIVNVIAGSIRGRKTGSPQTWHAHTAAWQLYFIALLVLIFAIIIGLFDDTLPYVFLLFSAIAAFIAAQAGIYVFTSQFRQWRWLRIVHVASIIVAFVMGVILLYAFTEDKASSIVVYSGWEPPGVLATAEKTVFFAGQAAFIVNVAAGLFRGKKTLLA